MRLALITNNFMPPREGVSRHIFEIALRLPKHGITPLIVAKGSQRVGWQHGGIRGVAISRYPYLGLRPVHQHLLRRTLQAWVDEDAGGADALHIHMPLIPPLSSHLPRTVTFHSPLAADTAAISENDWRARLIKLNARWFSRDFEQDQIDQADRIIAVSRGVAAELREHYSLGNKPLSVITNGVDTRFFPFIRGDRRQRRLLYVGRLGYRKGLTRLLDALAHCEVPRLRLDLAGEGPLAGALARRAEKLGIADRVEFLGFLDRNQLRERLKTAAALVNPADYETGPLTLLEAMATGTPVITTRTGIAAELGDDAPLLFAEKDVSSLATAIAELMDLPEAARQRAQEARRLAEQRFDWDFVCAELAQILRPRIVKMAA